MSMMLKLLLVGANSPSSINCGCIGTIRKADTVFSRLSSPSLARDYPSEETPLTKEITDYSIFGPYKLGTSDYFRVD